MSKEGKRNPYEETRKSKNLKVFQGTDLILQPLSGFCGFLDLSVLVFRRGTIKTSNVEFPVNKVSLVETFLLSNEREANSALI